MIVKKKIVTSVITGTLLLAAFTPAAFAHSSNDNSYGNKDFSYNAVLAKAHEKVNDRKWSNRSHENNDQMNYNAVDQEYLQMMIPHHREAIAMADEELSRGSKGEVKAMAEKIKKEQMMGLEKAENLYREVFDHEPPSGMTMTMLPELKSSEDVDHAFLTLMIKHHSEGIMHDHKEINEGENHEVKQFANKDIPMQSMDIDEMSMLLHEHFE